MDTDGHSHIAHLSDGLGHADRHAGLSRYCTGPMLPPSRKSVEPMASVLVKTAFISNPDEEARLRSDGYQIQLADALMRGITRHFARNPPPARNRALQAGRRAPPVKPNASTAARLHKHCD